jgi:hypothetical protein
MTIFQRWKQTALHNKALVLTGVIVAVGTLFGTGAAIFQVAITRENNHNTSEQVQQLINAANIQARAATNNAEAANKFATSADGINKQAEASVKEVRKLADEAKQSSNTAKRALDASSRAWIAPSNAYFTSEIAKNVPLSFEVQYRNIGKSPALDVHPTWTLQKVPGSKFDDNTFNAFIETGSGCRNLKLAPGADVIYSDLPDPYKLIFDTHLPGWVDDDILAGRAAIVLQMCFAYGTMAQVHHTSFCYFYRVGMSPPNKQMNICTAGNHAD